MALSATVALAAVIAGGPRGEWLRGTAAADRIAGNGGADRIHGLRGRDHLHGGPSADRLFGEVDRVRCGPGRDLALLDTVDVIVGASARRPDGSCERVERAFPQAQDGAPEDAEEAPADANRTE